METIYICDEPLPELLTFENKTGNLIALHADVLSGSSGVSSPMFLREETRDEPLRTSAWEASNLIDVKYCK